MILIETLLISRKSFYAESGVVVAIVEEVTRHLKPRFVRHGTLAGYA